MQTTANVFLLTAAVTLVGYAVATIEKNLLMGSVEFVLGVLAFVMYEKFPASPTL